MSKSVRKKEEQLKVHGTFEDIIKASVSNIDMKKVAAKKKAAILRDFHRLFNLT